MDHLSVLKDSQYGIYCNIDGQDMYTQDNSVFNIKRKVIASANNVVLKLSFSNLSEKKVKVYSAVIFDIILPLNVESVLEHGWLQSTKSGYKKVNLFSNQSKFLMKRNYNRNSFKKQYGYLPNSVLSEWFTIIKHEPMITIGAITTSEQFTQIYIKKEKGIRVRVTCQFDGVTVQPGQTMDSEKISVVIGQDSELKYLKQVAKNMKAKTTKRITGICCSYYWRGNYVDADIVDKEIKKSTEIGLKLDYVLIDAGYNKIWGDWLDYHDRFPNMPNTVKTIKDNGYKAGIWIAPFVAQRNSKLYKNHRDWFSTRFVHARDTTPFDRVLSTHDLRALDPTNDEYLAHLGKILTHFKDLGFEFFKLDFLYAGCLYEDNKKNYPRAKALRYGLEYIRKCLGKNSIILSAISPLSPLVGIVDSARVSVDSIFPLIKVPLAKHLINNIMMRENIQNNEIRKKFNNILWHNDPDCVLLSMDTGIIKSLVNKHKDIVKNYHQAVWIGDRVTKLNTKEIAELKELITLS